MGEGEGNTMSTGVILLLVFGIPAIFIVATGVMSYKFIKFIESLPDEVWEGVAEEMRRARKP